MTLKAAGTVNVKNDIHTEASENHNGAGVGGTGVKGNVPKYNWVGWWRHEGWVFGGGYVGSGGGGGHGGAGGKSSRASGHSGGA
jgi:hypothetical protein